MGCCCNGGGAALAGVAPPNFAAPAGTLYIASSTGLLYQNVSGTATGWYVVPRPFDMNMTYGRHEPRVNNAAAPLMFGVGLPNGVIGSSLGAFAGAFGAGVNIPFVSNYTNSNLNDKASFRSGTFGSGTFWPTGQDITPEHNWDVTIHLRLTARPRLTSNATTLANVRIWFAVLTQSATDIAIGNYVSSNVLRTYFQTGLPIQANLWGAAFRFSTSAGDAAWQLVTTNNDGVAYSETVQNTGVTLAQDSNVILRIRYHHTPVRTIFASVNYGPEFTATANVGPGNTNANLPMLSCHAVVETLAALEAKSLGWSKTYQAVGLAAF